MAARQNTPGMRLVRSRPVGWPALVLALGLALVFAGCASTSGHPLVTGGGETPPPVTPIDEGEIVIVEGIVISGGDTTPPDLLDGPRRFVYSVRQADDSTIEVSYVAYPPSPAGEQKMKQIELSFHAGTVRIGDRIEARGRLDPATQRITVADEGDYIRTRPGNSEGETMPTEPSGGIMAAPNSSHIKAHILSVERSEQAPNRWNLNIEILSAESIEGPNFARANTQARAFTFDPPGGLTAGRTLTASAEYLGGPQGGWFQLTDLKLD